MQTMKRSFAGGLARFLKKDPELEVVAEAEDGEVALALTKEKKPDLLLVDINMPFLNGLEFIEALQKAMEHPVIVIITGYDSFAYAQRALRLGVMDYLLKPISEQTLFPVLDQAKAFIRSKREKDQLPHLGPGSGGEEPGRADFGVLGQMARRPLR